MRHDFKQYLRSAPFEMRYDLTHIVAQPGVFKELVESLSEPFLQSDITKVAGLEAMGLGLAGGVACRLNTGLVVVRKGGGIAWTTTKVLLNDYSGKDKTLEMTYDAVSPHDRVLLIDDWSETGAQLKAAMQLIGERGATVVGAACLGIEKRVVEDAAFQHFTLHSVIEL